MSTENLIAEHYSSGGLLDAILAGAAAMGKTADSMTVEDLAPVDEFHIGGRQASEAFIGQLEVSAADHVLDVGCGLGGTARFVVDRYGARVTGIDVTTEFVVAGQAMCGWLGMEGRIALHQGSALDMPFDDGAFDAAYMLHVGMNIADKETLFAEVARVLKPGTVFGVYDVMLTGPDKLSYPVPWAASADTSALATPEAYKEALTAGGFDVVAERNRHGFAVEFFEALRARTAAAGGPPPLGLHLVMGADAPTKIANMVENIAKGRIAPVEMIARKA